MHRRWITIEIEPTTVINFTLPRLTKVVNGTDPEGITAKVGWKGAGSFTVGTVGDPEQFSDGVIAAISAT